MDIGIKLLMAYTVLNAMVLLYDLGFNIFGTMVPL